MSDHLSSQTFLGPGPPVDQAAREKYGAPTLVGYSCYSVVCGHVKVKYQIRLGTGRYPTSRDSREKKILTVHTGLRFDISSQGG